MFHKMRKNAKSLKSLFNKVEIRKQLYIVYFFAGILPILIIGAYLLINTRNLVLDQHYSQASADNVRVRSIMLDVTISLSNISDDFFSDKELQGLLASTYPTREEAYSACRDYTKTVTYAGNYTEISKLNVYFDNDSMYDYGHFKKATDEIKETEWYKTAAASWGYHWMTIKNIDETYETVTYELTLVRKMPVLTAGDYAILYISVSKDFLKSRINTSPLLNEISVNDDPIFYSFDSKQLGKQLGMPIDYENKYFSYTGIRPYNETDALLEVSSLPPIKSQDKLHIATIDYTALPGANGITWTGGLIVMISLLVPFIMVFIFSRTFSVRIKTLRQEMHKVSMGQLDIIEDFWGNDELADLYTDLKKMITSIKERDAEIYNDRMTRQKLITHQQEMQYEMLASQINPHFLFNTLETIRMKAFGKGDTEVATAIKLLGKSMRHVLETSGKLTSLKSELEYIATYLDIQKLRFLDKIDYGILVPDDVDTEEYKILPLLLQPIVENAFVHGLENVEKGGYIHIDIKSEANHMMVVVSDNGGGMTDTDLKALLEKLKAPQRDAAQRSIGLYNINRRIKLYYGDEYGIDIKSVSGSGTQVFIILPLDFSHSEKISGAV